MTDQISEEIHHYLNFLSLDHKKLDAAKVAWAIIEPHMPILVENFYEHLLATGHGRFFKNKDFEYVKKKQQAYWKNLFSGSFHAAYMQHANKIHAKHQAIGVGFPEYIGSYAWFSEHFFQILARSTPPKPYKRDTLLMAVNKVIYLDMMIATASANLHILDI